MHLKDGEDWEATFPIDTREEQVSAGEVHERRPVQMPEKEKRERATPGRINDCAKAGPRAVRGEVSKKTAKTLVAYPVDGWANNARTQGRAAPDLRAP